MSTWLKGNYHWLLVTLAAAWLVASSTWVWHRHLRARAPRERPVVTEPALARYQPADRQLPGTGPVVWPEPSGQSRGRDWLFEVFTPPVIYYDPTTSSFAVTPPRHAIETTAPFGLELIEVKREPYRLQVAGYFGGPEDRLVAFVCPNEPETRFAHVGDRFDSLGLTLRSFEVRKVVVGHTGAGPVYEVAGVAVLWDEKNSTEVLLDSRSRKLTDTPVAVFRLRRDDGESRELHEGDTFADETSRYRVEHIQLEPAEVVVAWYSPGQSLLETRTIRPATTDKEGGSPPAVLTSLSKRPPAAGLAARND